MVYEMFYFVCFHSFRFAFFFFYKVVVALTLMESSPTNTTTIEQRISRVGGRRVSGAPAMLKT